MQDSRGARDGREANEGTKGGATSPSQDSLVPFLLLSMGDEGSYDSQLRERLGELGFDGTGPEEMYRALWRMEREGMVVCNRDGSGFKIPRRWYEITESGRAYLESLATFRGRHQEDMHLSLEPPPTAPSRGRPNERGSKPGASQGPVARRRRRPAVERGKKVQDERGRRGREDYQELDRLLVEADRSLEGEDLSGANKALEQAGIKAASMWGEDGRVAPPTRTRKLVGLLLEVREDLNRPRRDFPHALRKDLRQLRSRFALKARRDAKKTAAGARPALREEGAGRAGPSRQEAW